MKEFFKDIVILFLLSVLFAISFLTLKTFIFGINEILDYSSCSPIRELYKEEILYPALGTITIIPILATICYSILHILAWIISFIPIRIKAFSFLEKFFARLNNYMPIISYELKIIIAAIILGLLFILLIYSIYIEIISDLCS